MGISTRLVITLALGALTLAPSARAAAQPSARTVQAERVAWMIAHGDAAQRAGNAIAALSYYRDAISAAPRKSEGYVALGSMYLTLDEPLRALEVFEVGTRAAASDEALWLGLAETLRKLGQDERALDALRHLRALTPSPRGLAALAEALAARGSFVEALAARRALVEQLVNASSADAPAGEPSAQDAAAPDLAAELRAQRAQVRALELLLGSADRVRARDVCSEPGASVLLRALARCP
jgi:tetratricopeptide (TPR) repeat protein